MIASANFVESYIEAWNQHDPAGVAEHLTLGGVYCDVPAQRQLDRDRLVAHLKDYFTGDSNRYTLAGEVLTGENSIAFQYRASPDGPGEDEGWTGIEVITMEGNGAGRIEDYYREPSPRVRGRTGLAKTRRYEKSGLSGAGLESLLARLMTAMEQDQAYLDAQLSLPELAAQLGCSVNHLSQAINAGHGVSFFDFINRYRVLEATNILLKEKHKAPAILDVALEVGFNSTSTFYSAFKKTTGQTPAQFRRDSLKQG